MNPRHVLVLGDDAELIAATREEFESRGEHVRVVATLDQMVLPDREQVDALAVLYRPIDDPSRIGETARRMDTAIRTTLHALTLSGAGRIVLMSGRDYLGWPGRSAAAADLAAVVGLARSLALELGDHGITVNAVCPPAELGDVAATENPWEAPPPPLTGPMLPRDVAFAIAFLADPDSGYLTGQIVHVSGGLHVLSSLSA